MTSCGGKLPRLSGPWGTSARACPRRASRSPPAACTAGKAQQTQGVGHGGTGTAHAAGGLLLGQTVALHQRLVALGLLDGVQVLALQVFDQRQLGGELFVGLDDADGNLLQTRQPGGAPAALAGDDLIIAVVDLPDRDGLDQPVLPDGFGQLLGRFRVKEISARLILRGSTLVRWAAS